MGRAASRTSYEKGAEETSRAETAHKRSARPTCQTALQTEISHGLTPIEGEPTATSPAYGAPQASGISLDPTRSAAASAIAAKIPAPHGLAFVTSATTTKTGVAETDFNVATKNGVTKEMKVTFYKSQAYYAVGRFGATGVTGLPAGRPHRHGRRLYLQAR